MFIGSSESSVKKDGSNWEEEGGRLRKVGSRRRSDWRLVTSELEGMYRGESHETIISESNCNLI